MKAHNFKDITGQKFGRLTVIEQGERLKPKIARWLCLCDCGETKIVESKSLRHGLSQSCGCLKMDRLKLRVTTHGMTNSKEYKIWCGMKRRCYNKNERAYKTYGARGITVCHDWLHDFQLFFSDMGKCPDGFSIERSDVNGNYNKENCSWIPLVLQASNRTNNVYLTYNNETKTISDWARFLGLQPLTLAARIRSGRWSLECALTTPTLPANHPKNRQIPPL